MPTYMIIFYHFLNDIFQWNLLTCSNKYTRFHIKMEDDEETAAAIVVLLPVKKLRKK